MIRIKSFSSQRLIFKIHTKRLKEQKWNLSLPLGEARKNEEVVAIADSQMLRWIDELNEKKNTSRRADEIQREIQKIKKRPDNVTNRREIQKLYKELDSVQFTPDYMCLIMDSPADYRRACRGFKINGVEYARLLGTNGGIKNSTVVFVNKSMSEELKRRIENGRNTDVKMVTAKLEAYKALTCSASTPVSTPKGILVVKDCQVSFKDDIISLNDENDGEPVMEYRENEDVTIDASDGFGLMLPSLASRWSKELGLDYRACGFNLRFAFLKGMAFAFDFYKFADEVADGRRIVKDIWGNDVDIKETELILTESMVKLWDSYESREDYLLKSVHNGYSFSVTKVCPKQLERERNLNYQFIQIMDLNDDEVEGLISPTAAEIEDVLGGDADKTALFLKGCELKETDAELMDDDIAKAIMVDKRMMKDPYAQSVVRRAIKNRINEAKIGVLRVHGNFSVVSGDPYALCQSIFDMPVTGLLKRGEIYNQYWADIGADRLSAFRAPMSCANNVRAVRSADNDGVRKWYRYMDTCTIFNVWGTEMAAMNGLDFDGDIVLLTDNDVIVNKVQELPALMCFQRRAEKTVPSEADFIKSNIDCFGSDIGQVTNRITSMYEIRARYENDSAEYKELSYRIMAGQQYQQNAIDKTKGIVCKPMPKAWYDKKAARQTEDKDRKELYENIAADRKPYFMRYIYPDLMKRYNNYIKNTTRKCLREFEKTVDELKATPYGELSEKEKSFLRYYDILMPVGTSDCTMNKICKRIEQMFDKSKQSRIRSGVFDYSIMKSGREYSTSAYYSVKRLYERYNERLKECLRYKSDGVSDDETGAAVHMLQDCFRREAESVCSNREELCDIVLDVCYKNNEGKSFAWSVCGDVIIDNLLKKNNNLISIPIKDERGELTYRGEKFTVAMVECDAY